MIRAAVPSSSLSGTGRVSHRGSSTAARGPSACEAGHFSTAGARLRAPLAMAYIGAMTVYITTRRTQSPPKYHTSADCPMVKANPNAYKTVPSPPPGYTPCERNGPCRG